MFVIVDAGQQTLLYSRPMDEMESAFPEEERLPTNPEYLQELRSYLNFYHNIVIKSLSEEVFPKHDRVLTNLFVL